MFRAYDSTTFESRIYIKDPSVRAPALLRKLEGAGHYVKWSPDGQQILFDAHPDEEEGGVLYVMDRRGLGVRRITPKLPARTFMTGHAWGPGRNQVTYVTGQVHNNGAVWVVDLNDTGAPRKLIDNGGVFHGPPAWSPDGSRLAYAWAEAEGSAIDLWVVDRDGDNARRLTDRGRGVYPSWSPDGTRIVCVSILHGLHGELTLLHVDGAEAPVRLTDNDSWETTPVWLPGGNWIAYVRNRDIHLIRPDGSEHHALEIDSEPFPPSAFDWYDASRPVPTIGQLLLQWGDIKAPGAR